MYWWLCSYHVLPGFWEGLCFFLLFLGVPLLAFILCRKNKGVRWYIVAVLIAMRPLMILRYSQEVKKKVFTYDESYLIGDSTFAENAATVMPSREMVEGGTMVLYECQLRGEDSLSIYRLSVAYDETTFESEAARLEAQYLEERPQILSGNNFYLDGAFYQGYYFIDDRVYAFAYNVCSNSKVISYIFFCDSTDLSSMDVGNALKYAYDMNVYVIE